MMRRAARIDGNHGEIVAALRAIGCTVQSLAAVGCGVPDLLAARNGVNYLLEIKSDAQPPSKQRLTADEIIWHNNWNGRVSIVTNVREALAAVGAVMQ